MQTLLMMKITLQLNSTYSGGISGGEPALPYAYSGLQVIFAISPTWHYTHKLAFKRRDKTKGAFKIKQKWYSKFFNGMVDVYSSPS